mmetsp:Transcript_27370/g.64118  ORF Transcript_27370/g.64118 Transcript_27370/m.64118 type:complete len:158 (+) Transcript_27370:3-476(+)
MFVFISGYQIGFGPISWTVLSEIYPNEIRGNAMALSVEVNFFAKFLTHFLFPVIQDRLGWGNTFLVFAAMIALGLIFVCVKVPETKGMTLEEIQYKLKHGWTKSEKMDSAVNASDPSSARQDFRYANMESMDLGAASGHPTERRSDPEANRRLAPIV